MEYINEYLLTYGDNRNICLHFHSIISIYSKFMKTRPNQKKIICLNSQIAVPHYHLGSVINKLITARHNKKRIVLPLSPCAWDAVGHQGTGASQDIQFPLSRAPGRG